MLAEVAGAMLGAGEGEPDEPRARIAAQHFGDGPPWPHYRGEDQIWA